MGHSTLTALSMRLTTVTFILTAMAVVLVYLAEAKPSPSMNARKPIGPQSDNKEVSRGDQPKALAVKEAEEAEEGGEEEGGEEDYIQPPPTEGEGEAAPPPTEGEGEVGPAEEGDTEAGTDDGSDKGFDRSEKCASKVCHFQSDKTECKVECPTCPTSPTNGKTTCHVMRQTKPVASADWVYCDPNC